VSSGYRAVQWSPGKRRYDLAVVGVLGLYLATFVAVTLLRRPEITAETALIRAFGTAALLLLHLVLAIGPAARLDRRFLPLLWNRRHLGVTMFLCALAHGLFALVQFHALGDRNPLVSLLVSNTRFDSLAYFPFQQLGLAAILILFLMAATSHDFWLANLTAPVWKALHLAVYLAYGLVVAHVALGVLQDERSPVLAGTLALGVAMIAGLHLAAAARERRIDRAVAAAGADGFVAVGRVEEIAEKRAKVVALAGERVAVFRYDGKVSAISNVCQHQNGPLGEGKILDGCVTCPWHGYQYRPEDGASPAPFTEKVPTFRVRVIDGSILVDPKPLPPGTRVEPATFDPHTTGAPEDREAFFVGYLPVEAKTKGFLRRVVVAVGTSVVGLGVVFGAAQGPLGRGTFEYGETSELEGLLRMSPLPLLWTSLSSPSSLDSAREATEAGFRVVPLVGPGKHGVSEEVRALAGRNVRLSGSWIRRGGIEMLEVAGAQVIGALGVAEESGLPLGRRRLVGEVVDSKCFLGVMNPGEGKAHRDCAVRCISGGSPAALVARAADGTRYVLMLVTPEGRPLGPELLDRVAEPVAVDGEVVRLGNLALLVTEASAVVRLGENPAR
jgi:nitrite reductase/ring-hydroxylating ferredoxin subunit/DMSO/TMAO reductase YedYZ heme-binding membrane subunit